MYCLEGYATETKVKQNGNLKIQDRQGNEHI